MLERAVLEALAQPPGGHRAEKIPVSLPQPPDQPPQSALQGQVEGNGRVLFGLDDFPTLQASSKASSRLRVIFADRQLLPTVCKSSARACCPPGSAASPPTGSHTSGGRE